MTTPHPSTPWDIDGNHDTIETLQLTETERLNGRLTNISAALGAIIDGLEPHDRDWAINIAHVIAAETNAIVDDFNRRIRVTEMRLRLAEETNDTLGHLINKLGDDL